MEQCPHPLGMLILFLVKDTTQLHCSSGLKSASCVCSLQILLDVHAGHVFNRTWSNYALKWPMLHRFCTYPVLVPFTCAAEPSAVCFAFCVNILWIFDLFFTAVCPCLSLQISVQFCSIHYRHASCDHCCWQTAVNVNLCSALSPHWSQMHQTKASRNKLCPSVLQTHARAAFVCKC